MGTEGSGRTAPGFAAASSGFTLIELLIVIAIILILIAIALPNFLEAQIRARLTNTRACLQTYRTANEAYFTDFNIHAPDVDGGEVTRSDRRSYAGIFGQARGFNCARIGEGCTFYLFTSPIPYLKELCYDPFLRDRNDPQAGKPITFPEYTTYRSGTPQREAWGNKYGLRYVILSRGPDLDSDPGSYDELWLTLGAHIHHVRGFPAIYSPTNGTKSNGDLLVSNRGHEGP